MGILAATLRIRAIESAGRGLPSTSWLEAWQRHGSTRLTKDKERRARNEQRGLRK